MASEELKRREENTMKIETRSGGFENQVGEAVKAADADLGRAVMAKTVKSLLSEDDEFGPELEAEPDDDDTQDDRAPPRSCW